MDEMDKMDEKTILPNKLPPITPTFTIPELPDCWLGPQAQRGPGAPWFDLVRPGASWYLPGATPNSQELYNKNYKHINYCKQNKQIMANMAKVANNVKTVLEYCKVSKKRL